MLAVNLNLNLDLKPKPKPKPSPTVNSLLLWCVPCFILLLCHRFVFLRVHNAYAMFYDLRIAPDLCSFGFTTHTSCFMIYVLPQICVPSGSQRIRHVLC